MKAFYYWNSFAFALLGCFAFGAVGFCTSILAGNCHIVRVLVCALGTMAALPFALDRAFAAVLERVDSLLDSEELGGFFFFLMGLASFSCAGQEMTSLHMTSARSCRGFIAKKIPFVVCLLLACLMLECNGCRCGSATDHSAGTRATECSVRLTPDADPPLIGPGSNGSESKTSSRTRI